MHQDRVVYRRGSHLLCCKFLFPERLQISLIKYEIKVKVAKYDLTMQTAECPTLRRFSALTENASELWESLICLEFVSF